MADPLAGLPGIAALGGARSIPALWLNCVDRSPQRAAFTVREGLGFSELPRASATQQPSPDVPSGWRRYTLQDSLDNIAGLAVRLASLGVGKGTPVAILGETSHAWVALDLAILSLGGVTVGIYPTLLPQDILWQLRHCKAQVLVVEDAAQYERLGDLLEDLPDLRHVFSSKDGAAVPTLAPARPDPDLLRRRVAEVQPEDVAAIVYTSGTTGLPKGVVLRHRHFLANIAATAQMERVPPGSRSIVFLPLAHSLQRFAIYRGLVEEVEGWFSPTIDDLPEVIAHCRPTVLITVPRMLEKIRSRAESQAAARGPISAGLLRWTVLVGAAVCQLEAAGERVPRRLRLQQDLARKLVGARVIAGLGGALEHVISGGAALSVEVGQWFEAMGIDVCEGWGLTETCAPATMTTRADRALGTVGRALPGMQIRIAHDGEVLVTGPGVFDGYLDDPEASADVLRDGWFHTGDFGAIDDDGRLRIVGRKKAIIVTAGGKNLAPEPIEKRLEGGLIDQAVVVGDERPYLAALLTIDEEALAAMASQGGWSGGPEQWRNREEVQAAIQARVDTANAAVARFSTVKRWTVLPDALTVDAGELTATLKVRRQAVAQRHAGAIAGLYA